MIKKILLSFAILFLLLAAAVIIFLATFDLNRYRKPAEAALSDAIHYPVRIGSLKLRIQNGIVVRAGDVIIGDPDDKTGKPLFLNAGVFSIRLALLPLLQKRILVRECFVESPKVIYSAFPNQTDLKEKGFDQNRPADPPLTPLPDASTFEKLKIGGVFSVAHAEISKIRVSNGNLTYRKIRNGKSFQLPLNHVNLTLRHVSLRSLVRIEADADITTEMVKRLALTGSFSYSREQIDLDVVLDHASHLTFSAQSLFHQPAARIGLDIRHLDLASFFNKEQKKHEYFSGSLSSNAVFQAQGKQTADWIRTLTGSGRIHIDDGALKNSNLIRENLNRITQIPGVGSLTRLSLGPHFDTILQSPDTTFQTLESEFHVGNKTIQIDSLRMADPAYQISLTGGYSFDRHVDMNGTLLIEQPLGNAITKKVKELVYLSNPKGQIRIPFVYRGFFPGVVPKPNVSGLVAKTVVNLGTELLQRNLGSWLGKKNPNSAAS